MRLRRLIERGILEFDEFLESQQTDYPQSLPEHILNHAAYSELVPLRVNVDKRNFKSRYEAAEYLNSQIGDQGIKGLATDIGIWTWLTLFYFDQVCLTNTDGTYKTGKRHRYIPEFGDYRVYYRHLLVGPYRIYRSHLDNPEVALGVLCNPLHAPGEIAEQMASRQDIVTNKTTMEVATNLYIDASTKRPKRGASSKGPGTPRRLALILDQLDLTWDLYLMNADGLLNLLPSEFNRFKT